MFRKKTEEERILSKAVIVSNGIVIVFPNKRKLAKESEKPQREVVKLEEVDTKSRFGKRNPEDNLGNFIGESDVPKSDSKMDTDGIGEYVVALSGSRGAPVTSILNEIDLLDMCDSFDCRLHELVKSLMDSFPDDFSIGFVRSKVRPFVYSLRKEKLGYERGLDGYGYKAIFDHI